jgi:galactose mutarotase-like enzyme
MQLSNESLTIELATRGGELRSIRTPDGAEWLWQGDPAWWGGRSPLLFPVVGKSPRDTVTIAGTPYPMPAHGVARINDWTLADSTSTSARFTLEANAETKMSYPFDFLLEITYTLTGNRIDIVATATNRDTTPMPLQFGYHPGFNWPLPGSEGKPHAVTLANHGEPALYRLNADKLLLRTAHPSPFDGGHLLPAAGQYGDDAMIFVEGAGNQIAFFADGGGRVDMETDNLPNFALWQKPGAPYLCLEPWHGTAPFTDQGDALETRNDSLTLASGQSASFRMDLTITPA